MRQRPAASPTYHPLFPGPSPQSSWIPKAATPLLTPPAPLSFSRLILLAKATFLLSSFPFPFLPLSLLRLPVTFVHQGVRNSLIPPYFLLPFNAKVLEKLSSVAFTSSPPSTRVFFFFHSFFSPKVSMCSQYRRHNTPKSGGKAPSCHWCPQAPHSPHRQPC